MGLTHLCPALHITEAKMRSAAPAETSGRPYECFHGSTSCHIALDVLGRRSRCRRSVRLIPKADSRSSRNGADSSDLARMETAVPMDQRPATQLKELRDSQLYSWVGWYHLPVVCCMRIPPEKMIYYNGIDVLAGSARHRCVLEAPCPSLHWLLLLAGRPNSIPNV